MILNEKLFTPLNENKTKLTYNKIYDALEDLGYTSYPSKQQDNTMTLKRHKENNLDKAKEYLDSINIKYDVKFNPSTNLYVLNYHLTKELLGENYKSENPSDITLESDELISGKAYDDEIIVDKQLFDDFEKDSIINISFDEKEPQEYKMISEDEDGITMVLFGGPKDSLNENSNSKLDEALENKFTITAKGKNEPFYSTYMFIVTAKTEKEAIEKAKAELKASKANDKEILGADPTTQEDINKGINEIKDTLKEEYEDIAENIKKEQAEKAAHIQVLKDMVKSYENGSFGDKEVASVLKQELDKLEKEDITESLDEKVPASPEPGVDNGLATIVNKLIIDEWEAIDGYNSAIVAAEDNGVSDLADVFRDIANEENMHVGQLQAAMEKLSPNASSIKSGVDEGKKQLDETTPESKPKEKEKQGE